MNKCPDFCNFNFTNINDASLLSDFRSTKCSSDLDESFKMLAKVSAMRATISAESLVGCHLDPLIWVIYYRIISMDTLQSGMGVFNCQKSGLPSG